MKSSRLKTALKAVKRRFKDSVWKTVSRRRYLAPFYYHFLSSAFDGEMKSVIAGQLHHQFGDKIETVGNEYAFRRNIHRLEKGLSMRPRRKVFAASYIENTTAFFLRLSDLCSTGDQGAVELLEWSRDVLCRYFEVVAQDADPAVDAARDLFLKAGAHPPKESGHRVPFVRPAVLQPPVTYDEFKSLALNRKSIRRYEQRPLPREVIDKAVDVARFAPSACNRQPFEIRVYDEREMIDALGSLAGGAKDLYQNYPCLLVLVGRLRAFPKESDRHIIYIDASLAAMSLILAFETLGVGSCVVNWPDIPDKDAAVNAAMGLDPDERVVMMISAGFEDREGEVCWSQRKPIEEIRSFNRLTKIGVQHSSWSNKKSFGM
jgi:nitroreductase